MAKEMLVGMGDDHKIVGGMDEGDECFRNGIKGLGE